MNCAGRVPHELAVILVRDRLGQFGVEHLGCVAPLDPLEQIAYVRKLAELVVEESLPNRLNARILLGFYAAIVIVNFGGFAE